MVAPRPAGAVASPSSFAMAAPKQSSRPTTTSTATAPDVPTRPSLRTRARSSAPRDQASSVSSPDPGQTAALRRAAFFPPPPGMHAGGFKIRLAPLATQRAGRFAKMRQMLSRRCCRTIISSVLLTPFGTGAAHVMQFGPIRIEDPIPQPAAKLDRRSEINCREKSVGGRPGRPQNRGRGGVGEDCYIFALSPS